MQLCLMLGAGHTAVQRKMQAPTSLPEAETKWHTLDFNKSANPRFLFDLENLGLEPIPNMELGAYDEIHAYEVLEHFGKQGDFRAFFRHFQALWRMLKMGGLLMGSCPAHYSAWAWGDPGHTRIISPESFVYLTRSHYARSLGKDASSDYRSYVDPCWWEIEHSNITEPTESDSGHFIFALRKVA